MKEIFAMLVVCAGVVWLTYQITKAYIDRLDKKELPDESEVVGKELLVGSKFLKDGMIVKVVEGIKCSQCVYSNSECVGKKRPVCYYGDYRVHFKCVKR